MNLVNFTISHSIYCAKWFITQHVVCGDTRIGDLDFDAFRCALCFLLGRSSSRDKTTPLGCSWSISSVEHSLISVNHFSGTLVHAALVC